MLVKLFCYLRTAYATLFFATLLVEPTICWCQTSPVQRHLPWTSSKLEGVPDRPPAYTLERVFPKLSFKAPVSLHRFPLNSDSLPTRWVVIEQAGKIKSFLASDDVGSSDLMLDLASPPPKLSEFTEGATINAYSLAFHPRFHENRFVYVCYLVQQGKINPNGTHIARYQVRDTDPPTIDYQSETTILRFDCGGHNGCTVEFGPDGYLYISIGDLTEPTPPDSLKTGQDISDLYASILRINVDAPSTPTDGSPIAYSIPSDNPFVKLPQARGEIYAYGLRNPWRMSFDQKTGDLWVGDVGWELYEMVYRVRSGSNLGWSIKEGPGDVMPDLPIGPTPIQPADIALSHADACSVTGGFVYHGKRFPELTGKYIFGDWITRRYWAAGFDEQRVTQLEEIATTEVKPICFAEDRDGELLVLEYIQWDQAGGIYRFRPNPAAEQFRPDQFPTKLSHTGLFRSLNPLVEESGVYPYSINSTMYMQGAEAEFHLAIPGQESARFHQQAQPTYDWFVSKVLFPKGTVLAKTYRIADRRIETQLSHYQGPNDWRFYTYRWLTDQSEALLVPAQGEKVRLQDSDGQQWSFSARSQCRICHTPWSGDAMGLTEEQLRRPHEANDSWRNLLAAGVISIPAGHTPASDDRFESMVGLAEKNSSLNRRARSYLHSNCSHCHQFGGNGSAAFDIRWDRTLAETKLVDAPPMKGDCGLLDARLVAAGQPQRSVLYSRMAKLGAGRMPHIGAHKVDLSGCQTIQQWISSLPQEEQLRTDYATLTEPIQKGDHQSRVQSAKRLLESIPGAMLLAREFADGSIHPSLQAQLLPEIVAAPAEVREYVEFLLPQQMQLERLGSEFDSSAILELNGDVARGAELFRSGVGQCVQCHKVGEVGKQVGPDFNSKSTQAYSSLRQLLEQIIKPSQNIAPEYRATTFVTINAQTVVGRVISRDAKLVRLALQDGSEKELPLEDIELEQASQVSLMPENLLAALTAQQAADLLQFIYQTAQSK
jgi:putative heme-binding domain-containing protein